MQQPEHQIVAAVGDIIATRLKDRGLRGIVVDGRTRDIESCSEICATGEFQMWTRGLSAVGTSMEAKAWAIDVPLQIGAVCVRPGDIVCADELDGVVSVIPRDLLPRFLEMMPVLKRASDNVIASVKGGSSLPDAIKQNPDFYSNYK
jgi:regulator of RNase E activity RraA